MRQSSPERNLLSPVGMSAELRDHAAMRRRIAKAQKNAASYQYWNGEYKKYSTAYRKAEKAANTATPKVRSKKVF